MAADRYTCFVIMPFSQTTDTHTEEYWTDHFDGCSIGPCSWRGSAGLLTRRGGGLAAAGAGSARGGTGGRGLLSFLCAPNGEFICCDD